MSINPRSNDYSTASVDALVAGTAGLGLPDIGGYPLLKLLQKNTPEVDRYAEGYVEGAELGKYWLAALEKLYDRPVPQLIGLRPYWKEWLPNRGGPGDEHSGRPEEATKTLNPDTRREQWRMPNGNMVEQTCDLVMLLDGIKCGLPFKSTGLTALRNYFIIPLKQERITLGDGKQVEPALFHVKARLGAKPESNSWGSWLNPTPEEFLLYRQHGGPTEAEIVAGFKAAQGYLQLSADKLKALPVFDGVEGPPAPPRTKPIITSGPEQLKAARFSEANPPPVTDFPPVDLADEEPIPF
jgi:hypothetical protein